MKQRKPKLAETVAPSRLRSGEMPAYAAPEAAGGAITSPALSVYAETLKTPQGPKMGLVGQTVKGNHNDT